ncbi:unknown [Clostridium sp. CAG:389]|nr:unknown [Clostridium sp. CAG:389]
MKKLLAIICILLVIFIGMYINKNKSTQNMVTATEVENVQEYISKIYMWKEVTEEALPKFDNINDAPDVWTWEVVKKNLDNYEATYEEIEQKAIQLFGKQFTKQFPEEGTEYIQYNDELGKYLTSGIGLDALDDCFLIKNIKKTKSGYEVEIVEYLEDYENSFGVEDESEIYEIYIKNLNQDTIATMKNNEAENKSVEIVKENLDKFTTKTVNLVKDSDGNIYVQSVK